MVKLAVELKKHPANPTNIFAGAGSAILPDRLGPQALTRSRSPLFCTSEQGSFKPTKAISFCALL